MAFFDECDKIGCTKTAIAECETRELERTVFVCKKCLKNGFNNGDLTIVRLKPYSYEKPYRLEEEFEELGLENEIENLSRIHQWEKHKINILEYINPEKSIMDFKTQTIYIPIKLKRNEYERVKTEYLKAQGITKIETAWDILDELLQDIDEEGKSINAIRVDIEEAQTYLSDFVRENMSVENSTY